MTRATSSPIVRALLAASAALAAVALPDTAFAQSSFGKSGSIVISGERLAGLYYNQTKTDGDGFDDGDPVTFESDTSSTTFAFLGSGLGADTGGVPAGPAGVPRVGFDYFFMQSMSLGLSLTYVSRNATDEISGTRMMGMTIQPYRDEIETTETLFVVAPRFGYALGFTNLLGLWAHGALTYTRFGVDRRVTNIAPGAGLAEDSETSVGAFGLAVDAQLVIAPIEHVAFGVGPLFEIAPIGDFDSTDPQDTYSVDGEASILSLGIAAGLIVWL